MGVVQMNKETEERILMMLNLLDEKQLRYYLAKESQGIGRGGIKAIQELTGVFQTLYLFSRGGG